MTAKAGYSRPRLSSTKPPTPSALTPLGAVSGLWLIQDSSYAPRVQFR